MADRHTDHHTEATTDLKVPAHTAWSPLQIHYLIPHPGLKSLLLEKRLEAVAEALEMKEAQLAEVLTAANLDPSTLSVINSRLEEVLDNKNQVCVCWGGEANVKLIVPA